MIAKSFATGLPFFVCVCHRISFYPILSFKCLKDLYGWVRWLVLQLIELKRIAYVKHFKLQVGSLRLLAVRTYLRVHFRDVFNFL